MDRTKISQVAALTKTQDEDYTEAAIINKAKLLSKIRKYDGKSFIDDRKVYRREIVDYEDINSLFQPSAEDLEVLNNMITNLTSEVGKIKENLNQKIEITDKELRKAASYLDEVSLYSSLGPGVYGAAEKFLIPANIVSPNENALSIDSGQLMLPIAATTILDLSKATVSTIDNPEGVFEDGHPIENAIDNDKDSYFYYYQIAQNNNLNLKFEITLKDKQIINQIVITFSLFNSIPVETLSIETSADGAEYLSLEFEDGATFGIFCTFAAHDNKSILQIECEEGCLEVIDDKN